MALFSHPHITSEMDRKVEAALQQLPDDLIQLFVTTFEALANDVYATGYDQGYEDRDSED